MKKGILILSIAIITTLIVAVVSVRAQGLADVHPGFEVSHEFGILTNCNDAAINAAVTCGDTRGIATEGFDNLKLAIDYTRAAGTGFSFYLQECIEGHATTHCTDAADWRNVPVRLVTATSGVQLANVPYYVTSSATISMMITIPINAKRLRLGSFVASGSPTSSDKITVRASASRRLYGKR